MLLVLTGARPFLADAFVVVEANGFCKRLFYVFCDGKRLSVADNLIWQQEGISLPVF